MTIKNSEHLRGVLDALLYNYSTNCFSLREKFVSINIIDLRGANKPVFPEKIGWKVYVSYVDKLIAGKDGDADESDYGKEVIFISAGDKIKVVDEKLFEVLDRIEKYEIETV